jgi:hypothetical protein
MMMVTCVQHLKGNMLLMFKLQRFKIDKNCPSNLIKSKVLCIVVIITPIDNKS